MEKNVVRYGLISTSQIGVNAHLPASLESKNSAIVSISSRTASKAKAATAKHGILHWYGSYEEQLADPGVDAAINALPISMPLANFARLVSRRNSSSLMEATLKKPKKFRRIFYSVTKC